MRNMGGLGGWLKGRMKDEVGGMKKVGPELEVTVKVRGKDEKVCREF